MSSGTVAGLMTMNKNGSDRPAVEARALVKRYGDVEAVRGVDLRVDAGEVFGFLGPERRGQVDDRAHAHDAADDHVRAARAWPASTSPATPTRRAGGSASRCRRPGWTRARPAASCWCCRRGCSGSRRAEAAERAEELLELVELEDAADRRIKGYSGGMKRRLDLASALVHEPEVLFLDEPTTGLDPASRLTVWDEVRRINERGTTVFLTTQYLEEADALCDRLAIIDGGLIVREGTPASSRPSCASGAASTRPVARRRVPRRDRPHAQPGRRRRAGGVGMSARLGAGAARAARGVADAGGAAADAVHPAVLPRRQRRPGRRRSSRRPSTEFLYGQGYGAFQLPSSLLLAASFGTAALFLVEDIEGGYFDKLRAAPVSRSAIVLGPAGRRVRKALLIAIADRAARR